MEKELQQKAKSYINSFEFHSKRFLEHLETARKESYICFSKNEDLNQKVQRIYWFQDILIEIPSCDVDSLNKHRHFFPLPYKEAQIRLEESVSLAICGMYKSAYDSLRNSLELVCLGLYQSTSLQSSEDVLSWINSEQSTPSFKRIVNQLFVQPYFSKADQEFDYKNLLKQQYGYLCDYVHTKGENHSYTNLNLSNYPRFIEKTLVSYLADCIFTCELAAIGLSLTYPVILEPLPITQKMGLNLPAGGFLESFEVACLEGVIDRNRLEKLKEIVKDDEFANSIKDWLYSLPDLTEEEWQAQIEKEKQWEDEMRQAGRLIEQKPNINMSEPVV